MGKLLLLTIIGATALETLRRPFVGAMAYYCLAIWGPQYIWWWSFDGLRVSMIVAVSTILTFGLAAYKTGVYLDLLKHPINVFVFILWLSYLVSYNFGPYVPQLGNLPNLILVQFNKIIFFYFISLILVDNVNKAALFSFVIIAAMCHLTYWANMQYLSGNWSQFYQGRLMGPGLAGTGAIYQDENNFAMFFVSGVPFLFYAGLYLTKNVFRYALWMIVPFSWHAVFLTGSRGGIVGMAATLFAGWVLSRYKLLFAVILIPMFVAAFIFQGGDLIKSRSTKIIDYQGESSAETRLQAWSAAVGMLKAHPFTGVGVACFVRAMADFSPHKPRATHSVPFQFAGEIGIFAVVSYCLIVAIYLIQGVITNRRLKKYQHIFDEKTHATLQYLNEAGVVSFFGLSVCSLFLSLNYYEIFYFLLIISGFTNYYVYRNIRMADERQELRV